MRGRRKLKGGISRGSGRSNSKPRNFSNHNIYLDGDELISFAELQKFADNNNNDFVNQFQLSNSGNSRRKMKNNKRNISINSRDNNDNNNKSYNGRNKPLKIGGMQLIVENDYIDTTSNPSYNNIFQSNKKDPNSKRYKSDVNKNSKNKSKNKGSYQQSNSQGKNSKNNGRQKNSKNTISNNSVAFVKAVKESSEDDESDWPSYDTSDEQDPSKRVERSASIEEIETKEVLSLSDTFSNIIENEDEVLSDMASPFEGFSDEMVRDERSPAQGNSAKSEIYSKEEQNFNNIITKLENINLDSLITLDTLGGYAEHISDQDVINQSNIFTKHQEFKEPVIISDGEKFDDGNEIDAKNLALENQEGKDVIELSDGDSYDSSSDSDDYTSDSENIEVDFTDSDNDSKIQDYLDNMSIEGMKLNVVDIDDDRDMYIDDPSFEFKQGFFYAISAMLKEYPQLDQEEALSNMKKKYPEMFKQREKKSKNKVNSIRKEGHVKVHKTKSTNIMSQIFFDFLTARDKRKIEFPPVSRDLVNKLLMMGSEHGLVANCSGKGKKKVVTLTKTKRTVIPSSIEEIDLLAYSNIKKKNVTISKRTEKSISVTEGSGLKVNKAPPIAVSNVGHRLLSKMGWAPGQKLGTNDNGLLIPIQPQARKRNSGLGS